MGDLISQVVQLTQLRLAQRLAFSEELQSMVLEVRADSLRAMRFLRKILSRRPVLKGLGHVILGNFSTDQMVIELT